MRVLYLASSSNLWGARKSLLDILKFINREKFLPFVVIPKKGPIEKELKDLHIPYKIIYLPPWRKTNRFFQRKKSLRELKEFIAKSSFDLIHSNSHFVAPYGIKMGKFFSSPVITHIRDILTLDKIKKYYLQKSNLVICNSVATSEIFRNFPKEKVKVIYNGVDTESFSKRPSEEIKAFREKWNLEKNLIVGCIGKISREKGMDLLIRIIPEVIKRVPEIKFLIAGEVRREKDQDLVKKFKEYKGKVVLTGWIEDLPLFYSSIDVLFFPTRKESFGRVAMESLSCGTPVVAGRTGGVVEIVEEGVTGYLFSPRSYPESLKKLLSLLVNPSLRRKMGKRGRKKVKMDFEIRDKVREIEEIYKIF